MLRKWYFKRKPIQKKLYTWLRQSSLKRTQLRKSKKGVCRALLYRRFLEVGAYARHTFIETPKKAHIIQSDLVWKRQNHNLYTINTILRVCSRPIWRSTIERCPLLPKLCKALFWCKTLRKGIERGGVGGWNFGGLFFQKKCPFWPISIKCCPKFLEYALILFINNKIEGVRITKMKQTLNMRYFII